MSRAQRCLVRSRNRTRGQGSSAEPAARVSESRRCRAHRCYAAGWSYAAAGCVHEVRGGVEARPRPVVYTRYTAGWRDPSVSPSIQLAGASSMSAQHRRRRVPRNMRMRIERQGSVALLRMESGKVNAIGPAFLAEFGRLLDGLGDAGAAVLTGPGSTFSAGRDLPAVFRLRPARAPPLPPPVNSP